MFDEILLSDLVPWAVAAVVVAAALGCLRRSRLRSGLIWTWSLIPIGFVALIALIALVASDGDMASGLSFLAILLVAMLLPWAGLVLLSYNLVRRFREIHLGVE